jgi:hypothetical protein
VRGTPQYAPPEQLRGDPLDVRGDIYAVGATLYYLLTGRPPFQASNLFALLARIASEDPASPRTIAPAIPRELSAIVLRCLAKTRDERPPTYAVLHDALLPFSSAAPAPATLQMRFLAGVIDQAILSVPNWIVLLVFTGRLLSGWLPFLSVFVSIGYYGITEGVWSATAGKWLVGLRITRAADARRPRVARAMWRALLFASPSLAETLINMLFLQGSMYPPSPLVPWVTIGYWVLLGVLFTPARRHNGFAALHDRWSGTRVVQRLVTAPPLTVAPVVEPKGVAAPGVLRIGPFEVTGTMGATDEGVLLIALDPQLRRRVWIHLRGPGTPAAAAAARDLARPARLRWLGGQRTSARSWDAYEAWSGAPLQTWLDRPWPWRVVRTWLSASARELRAALDDGSLPVLSRDRVWITAKGDVKFLEFRYAPAQHAAPEAPLSSESARLFLSRLAVSALIGDAQGHSASGARLPYHMLPLSATDVLNTLGHEGIDWRNLVERLTRSAVSRDRVQRWRRAGSLALTLAVPFAFGMTMAAVLYPMRAFVTDQPVPEIEELWNALNALSTHSRSTAGINRAALEVYIAGRYGPMIEAQGRWNPATMLFLGRQAPRLWRIMADHPRVSTEELTEAATQLKPFFDEQTHLGQLGPRRAIGPWQMALGESALLLMLVAVAAIILGPLCRGGLALTLVNVAVITDDGRLISRRRALWRGVVTWSLVLAPLAFAPPPPLWLGTGAGVQPGSIGAMMLWILSLAGAMYGIARPSRGLQDYLSGTYLVPR